MASLTQRIMDEAAALPEAAPLCTETLGHLGERASVSRALSRLARADRLMRICRGIYMLPKETKYGRCGPGYEKAVKSLAKLWGETIVSCGAREANGFGLTTQVPVRAVYFTSGPSRKLHFGALTVTLTHAASWRLILPHTKAGTVIRALDCLNRHEIEDALKKVLPILSPEDMQKLYNARSVLPKWLAEPIGALGEHA